MSNKRREVTQAVLLAGRFRPYEGIYETDSRNTLIVELDKHTNHSTGDFQAMDDVSLAGAGAILGFLREGKIRSDQQLQSMSTDDQRNTLIVEIAGLSEYSTAALQKMKNMKFVLAGLGSNQNFIRGILLEGRFRTWREIQSLSHDDQRNALIVELVKHSNRPTEYFQAMNDEKLAGAGAVLVFLREAKIRTDQQLRTMSDDDQRNTVIVIAETHRNDISLPPDPSALGSLQLVVEEIHGYEDGPH